MAKRKAAETVEAAPAPAPAPRNPWDMPVQVVDLVQLTPDPRNARKHDQRNLDAIAGSLKAFGQRRALVVQRQGERLVVRAGNGTLAAMQRLGWARASVVIFDEGDDVAAAFAIADNRSAELASWDEGVLADVLSELGPFHQETTGFDEAELAELTKAWDHVDVPDQEALPGTAGAAFGLVADYRPPTTGKGTLDLPIIREDMLMPPPPPDKVPQVGMTARPWPGGLCDCRKSDAIKACSPGGIFHTWTEDKYFMSLFENPAEAFGRWLAYKPGGFIGIDYSTWIEMPYAQRLWAVYRSRWCTRYAQEAGLKCWLNYNPLHDQPIESNAGMPKGAYVAISLQTDCGPGRRGDVEAWSAGLDDLKPCGVLFYGDPKHREKYYEAAVKIAGRVDVVMPEYVLRRGLPRKQKAWA